ncbi:MAG TPA: peptide deformylase [Rhodospirillales bacterium]|nr:peptide deformylase [Rhodospirillales bacterium]
MATLRILEVPHPVLKRRAAPVERIDDEIRRLVRDMFETMYEAPGIGLAAPQVGVSRRLCVIDVSEEKNAPLCLVNPRITWQSENLVSAEEGCLSLPDQYAEVTRPEAVEVVYLDERGEEHTLRADGLLARCIQHEIDHLDGILFIDRISALKRNMILRKLAKARRLKASA